MIADIAEIGLKAEIVQHAVSAKCDWKRNRHWHSGIVKLKDSINQVEL